jgi:hypothetical protein
LQAWIRSEEAMSIIVHGPGRSGAAGARVRIVVEGTFDVAAARALHKLLRGESAVIDFSRAREIHDLALAQLAFAVDGAHTAGVTLRGLPVHSERILRYLGTTLGASSSTRGDFGDAIATAAI